MGGIVSCVITGVTWCFCSACASLCGACLGNDKPSTDAPSITSGRKRSVLLITISLGFAFAYQYGVAPALEPGKYSATTLTPVGQYLQDAWYDGCDYGDEFSNETLRLRCSGNAGVLRAAAAAVVFFLLAGIASACKPSANREAWPAKYVLFCFLAAGTAFIPNTPIFYNIFLQIARIGASIFILYQQVILIDMAYNWNESWVGKANQADLDEPGGGKKWLTAILVSCGILFVGSIVVIGLLYHYFSGCSTNIAFITVTLLMSIIITVAQLYSEEGSLLTSAVITAYATYLVFTAVFKNPNAECNPFLGEVNVLNIVLGIVFTLLSLSWTGWSVTAAEKLERSDSEHVGDAENPSSDSGGVVVNQSYGSTTSNAMESNKGSSSTWVLNCLLGLVSCWYAMVLTSWGTVHAGGDIANPDVGKVSMWMIMAWQWLALVLYLWTLVAPKLFPDRDFT